AIARLAGVIVARESGKGQAVEVPMFEAMAQLVLGDHLGGHTFEPPAGATGYARLLVSHRRPYATADGHISVLIYNDKHWSRFFDLIERPGLKSDPRFHTHTARAAHIDEAYLLVSEVMATRPNAYWLQALAEADIPAAPLYSVEDLMADAHIRAVGMLREFEHPTEGAMRSTGTVGNYSRTKPAIRRHAPRLGEHTREVLAEAGYS